MVADFVPEAKMATPYPADTICKTSRFIQPELTIMDSCRMENGKAAFQTPGSTHAGRTSVTTVLCLMSMLVSVCCFILPPHSPDLWLFPVCVRAGVRVGVVPRGTTLQSSLVQTYRPAGAALHSSRLQYGHLLFSSTKSISMCPCVCVSMY